MDHESELFGLDFVAEVLKPIKLVVWGDLAVRHLGVRVVHADYMLGVCDDEIELATKKLVDKGFVRQNWSFSCTFDPATRKDDERFQYIHGMIAVPWKNFDAKTRRFSYPDENKEVQRTVLIPSSYLYLSASESPSYPLKHGFIGLSSSSQPLYYVFGNLYYPNVLMLLQSIIKVILDETEYTQKGGLVLMLESWAITYLFEDLELRNDILADSKDEKIREYFDSRMKRGPNPGVREKWGIPKPKITNKYVKEFQ